MAVEPVADIAEKVKAVFLRMQPLDLDPLYGIDEHRLLHFAETSGFTNIHVEFHAEIKPFTELPGWETDWETLLRTAPNPRAPTFEEAMREALAPAEIDALVAHIRPLYEAKQGIATNAFAYLDAIK
jgi:hypothetical protein